MKNHRVHRSPTSASARQRGVVLLFSLIALVIMLIAAAALVRSFNSSLFTAGNIAFKRDLQNQGERAANVALTAFRAGGGLDTIALRAVNWQNRNYSASMLAVNAQGIPNALRDDATFGPVGSASNDIDAVTEPTLANQSVSIRYVIDRLCATPGDERLMPGTCVLANSPIPAGNSASNEKNAARAIGGMVGAAPQGVLYRLSVRVTGPRNTQSFFQSTFTIPSS